MSDSSQYEKNCLAITLDLVRSLFAIRPDNLQVDKYKGTCVHPRSYASEEYGHSLRDVNPNQKCWKLSTDCLERSKNVIRLANLQSVIYKELFSHEQQFISGGFDFVFVTLSANLECDIKQGYCARAIDYIIVQPRAIQIILSKLISEPRTSSGNRVCSICNPVMNIATPALLCNMWTRLRPIVGRLFSQFLVPGICFFVFVYVFHLIFGNRFDPHPEFFVGNEAPQGVLIVCAFLIGGIYHEAYIQRIHGETPIVDVENQADQPPRRRRRLQSRHPLTPNTIVPDNVFWNVPPELQVQGTMEVQSNEGRSNYKAARKGKYDKKHMRDNGITKIRNNVQGDSPALIDLRRRVEEQYAKLRQYIPEPREKTRTETNNVKRYTPAGIVYDLVTTEIKEMVFSFNRTWKFGMMLGMEATPLLPPWLLRMRINVLPILLKCSHTPDELRVHDYAEWNRYVDQITSHWWESPDAFCYATSVAATCCRQYLVATEDSTNVPGNYTFFDFVNVTSVAHDFKNPFDYAPSTSNVLWTMQECKIERMTVSRFKGIIKSVVTSNETFAQARKVLNSRFKRFSDLVDLRDGKIVNKNKEYLWFYNMLPPVFFQVDHKNGDSGMMKLLDSYVDTLRVRIVDYARIYRDVGLMSLSERQRFFADEAENVSRILSTPEFQMRFISGERHSTVKEAAYKLSKTTRTKRAEGEREIVRLNKGERMERRREKYNTQFEPESAQVFAVVGFSFVAFLSIVLAMLSNLFMQLHDILFSIRCAFGLVRPEQRAAHAFRTYQRRGILQILSDPKVKLWLIDIKSVIHAFIEYARGDKHQALMWATNLTVTRGVDVVSGIGNYIESSLTMRTESSPEMVAEFLTHLIPRDSLKHVSDPELRRSIQEMTYASQKFRERKDMVKLVSKIISVVGRTVFAYDPFDVDFQRLSFAVTKCIKEAREVEEKPPKTLPEMETVVTLFKNFEELRLNPAISQIPGYLKTVFDEKYSKMSHTAATCRCILAGDRRRVEPVFVVMTGAPDAGKTSTMNFIKQAIANKFSGGLIEDYPYESGSGFWEGYRGQMFVTMDDIFKVENIDRRSEEAESIIAMINSTAFNMNMAFENKGKMFFTSQFVFATSNYMQPDTRLELGLTDNRAFMRRVHLYITRDDKYEGDIVNTTYRVLKCAKFPNVEGTLLNPGQLANLMLKLQEWHKEIYERGNFSEEMLDLDKEEYKVEVESMWYTWNTNADGLSVPEFHQDILHDETFTNIIRASGPIDYIIVFGFIYFLIWSAQWFIKFLTATQMSEESHDTRRRTKYARNRRKKERTQRKLLTIRNGRLQVQHAHESENCVDTIAKSVVNTRAMEERYENNCQGLHLHGGYFVFSAHFIDQVVNNDVETIDLYDYTGKVFTARVPEEKEMAGIVETDFLIFKLELPQTLPSSLKYFRDEEDLEHCDIQAGARLLLLSRDYHDLRVKEVFKNKLSQPTTYNVDTATYVLEDPIMYDGATSPGDSGSPVVYITDTGKPMILGIHTGRITHHLRTYGALLPLSASTIKGLIASLEPDFCVQSSSFPLKVERVVQEGVPIPKRSKLRKSKLFGFAGPPKYVPAHLDVFMNKAGEIVDPKAIALAKVRQDVGSEPCDILPGTMDYLLRKYPRSKKYAVLLTIEEALNGREDISAPPIDGTTSAGYPWCLTKTKGKAPHVVTEDGVKVPSQELRDRVNADIALMMLGEKIEVIWTDMLKDETRPREKVEAGKTRLFTACPLHYLILGRMWCQGFISYVQSLSTYGLISVGINVHGNAWGALRERFMCHPAWKLLFGDFERWDTEVRAKVVRFCCEFINLWYDDGPVNAQIRRLIFEEMCVQTRIHEYVIYLVMCGIPSGSFITAILNSLAQCVVNFNVFVKGLGLRTDEFDFICYGDDNILYLNVPDITIKQLAVLYKEMFGMVYTHASKRDDVDISETIDEGSYLGRRFVLSGPYVLAPLELETILECVYWTRSKAYNLEVENVVNLYACVCMELSHHSQAVFDEWTVKLMDAIVEAYGAAVGYLCESVVYSRREYHINHYEARANSYIKKLPNPDGFMPIMIPESNPQIVETENTDFTTRGTNQLVTTQEVRIGDYQDAAPIAGSAVNTEIMQSPHESNNMETLSLDDILNREYLVASYTWQSSQGTNYNFVNVNFPDVMLSQSFVADKLKNFRYFRGGLRLSFRVSSSQFNYGRMMFAYVPDPTNDTYLAQRVSRTDYLSGFPHVLVSASSTEVCVMDIPFISPNRFIDMASATTAMMGRIYAKVLVPLTNINAEVTSCTIFMTAQFLNASVALPFQIQSGRRLMSKEAALKSKAHSISSEFEQTKTAGSSIMTSAVHDVRDALYDIASHPVSSAFRILGLDKPTTLARTDVGKINPYSDMGSSRGIDCSVKLAVDPENQITTTPNVGGVTADESDIMYIAGTPTYIRTFTFASSDAIGFTKMVCEGHLAQIPAFTYASWLAKLSAAYSGGIKVRIYISASTMHSARVGFYFNHLSSDLAMQNCYHRVVDIQGDTEVEFTLPYYGVGMAYSSLDTVNPVNLYARLLSYSQPKSGAATPISFLVYASAAEDFKIYGPRDQVMSVNLPAARAGEVTFQPESNPRRDFTRSFDPIHPSVTNFESTGYIYGEEIKSYRDFYHRYTPIRPYGGTTYAFDGTGNDGPGGYTGLEMYGLIYRFWRGSVRIKGFQKDGVIRGVIFENTTVDTPYVGNTFSCAVNPLLEFEIPYYHTKLFEQTCTQSPNRFYVPGANASNLFIFKAGGDDFSFHFLCPPPDFEFPGQTYAGEIGLQTFLTAT